MTIPHYPASHLQRFLDLAKPKGGDFVTMLVGAWPSCLTILIHEGKEYELFVDRDPQDAQNAETFLIPAVKVKDLKTKTFTIS